MGHVAVIEGGEGRQQFMPNFSGEQTDERLRSSLLLTWIFGKYEV